LNSRAAADERMAQMWQETDPSTTRTSCSGEQMQLPEGVMAAFLSSALILLKSIESGELWCSSIAIPMLS
jgi:hypothetical protein